MINILGVTKDIKACPRCGCYTMEYREMGIHIGKYCKNCNKWIKWVAHKEVPEELAARIIPTNTATENMCNDINEEDDTPWF